MALRLIEVYTPKEKPDLEESVDQGHFIELRTETRADNSKVLRILCEVEFSESIMKDLSDAANGHDGFRLILYSIEATLPSADTEPDKGNATGVDPEKFQDQPSSEKKDVNTDSGQNGNEVNDEEKSLQKSAQYVRPSGYTSTKDTKGEKVQRISTIEMYEDVKEMIDLSPIYITLTAMSAIVAATGMMRDNPAIVIGAMVIAPLLGPNVGLSLSTTLGDQKLLVQSLKSLFSGFSLAFALSIAMGVLLTFDYETSELVSRTSVSFADVALGFAAGIAGVLSFTRGISAAVIGVMVAVALLPPLVATGLYLGSGQYDYALGAAILTFTYVICFNLAGVLTLLAQGVTPKSWREKKKETRFSPYAIIFWLVLLAGMAVVIFFRNG
ncbi:MAG: TIGR00341 family protein [Balneolales bacterium]|nr:TIGR00341 family protein [Balneolales bacterium]